MNDETFSIKKFLKNIAGFSLASWVQAGINLISIPLVTRAFPTEEYGKITLFITVYTIITLCVRLSLEQGYTRFYYEYDERGRKDLLSQCFSINIVMFAITYILLFVFNRTIAISIFGEEAVLVICLFLPIIVVCNTIIEYQRVNFKMSENIRAYFILSVLSVIAGKFSILIAAFTKPSYFNAIFYMACAFFIQFLIVWIINPEGFKLGKLHIEKHTAATLIKYSLPFLISSLLVYLNNFISSMVLKNTLSYTAVAIFGGNIITNILQ